MRSLLPLPERQKDMNSKFKDLLSESIQDDQSPRSSISWAIAKFCCWLALSLAEVFQACQHRPSPGATSS